jgi:Zn-dependent metalloprotease
MRKATKIREIFSVALLAVLFLLAQTASAKDSSFSDDKPSIQTEHHILIDQLNQLTGSKVQIKTHARTGKVNYIGIDPSNAIRQPGILSAKPTPEDAARGFLSVYGPLFGLRDHARELTVVRVKEADRGRSSVRFQQVHSGISVFGGELIVQTDSSHNIISAHSKILSDILVETAPAITPEAAEKTALDVFIKSYQKEYDFDASSLRVSKPELWIYNPLLLGKNKDINYLVWRMQVTPKELFPIRKSSLWMHNSERSPSLHQNPTALNRRIYDRANTPTEDWQLPGDLIRSEGGRPSGITDVNNAYDYAGDTYNFYWNNHGRDSLDDAGMDLISTTRYCLPAIYGTHVHSQTPFGTALKWSMGTALPLPTMWSLMK